MFSWNWNFKTQESDFDRRFFHKSLSGRHQRAIIQVHLSPNEQWRRTYKMCWLQNFSPILNALMISHWNWIYFMLEKRLIFSCCILFLEISGLIVSKSDSYQPSMINFMKNIKIFLEIPHLPMLYRFDRHFFFIIQTHLIKTNDWIFFN